MSCEGSALREAIELKRACADIIDDMKLNILLIALFLGLATFLFGCFVYFLLHALPAKDLSRIIPVILFNAACFLILILLRRFRTRRPYFFKTATVSVDMALIVSWTYLLVLYLSD